MKRWELHYIFKGHCEKIFKACVIICDIYKESNYTQVYSVMEINY